MQYHGPSSKLPFASNAIVNLITQLLHTFANVANYVLINGSFVVAAEQKPRACSSLYGWRDYLATPTRNPASADDSGAVVNVFYGMIFCSSSPHRT